MWTFALRGGSGFSTEVRSYDQLSLGGLFSFPGYRHEELVGREFGWAGIQYRQRLGCLFKTLRSDTWGGVSLETGNVRQRRDGTPAGGMLTGGSAFVGVNSRLGSVYLGHGRSQGDHAALYLYLGSALEIF